MCLYVCKVNSNKEQEAKLYPLSVNDPLCESNLRLLKGRNLFSSERLPQSALVHVSALQKICISLAEIQMARSN